ncbi:MAG: efflux RND transporter permease subunit, partial [Aquamicrobium sp.]|nr:efflux RND transporter permease subunit [Aquamicrobium sp.]
MAHFFIDRPVFAWVVAIFIMLAGAMSLPFLPVAQYPNVAPPQISISTNYTGASPEEIYQSVTRPIEDELNGIPGLIYFESTSDVSGRLAITATFAPGTNIADAAVDVQNRVRRVEPRLPQSVTQQGIRIEQTNAGFLMMIAVRSSDGATDATGLGDFVNRNVIGEIRRIDGVGSAQLFAAPRAMRVWIDPDKMLGLGLTTSDVMN